MSLHWAERGPGTASLPLTSRVIAVLVLCGLIPLVLLWPTSDAFSVAFFVQSVVVVHSGAALAVVLTAPDIRIMQLGFWTFAYVWMGLAPLAMLVTGRFPWPQQIDQQTALLASTLTEVGLIAYSSAQFVARRAGSPPESGLLAGIVNRRFRVSGTLILTVLSTLLAVILLPRLGGLETAFSPRETASSARGELAGTIGDSGYGLLQWVMLVAAMWAMLALMRIRNAPLGANERVVTVFLLGLAIVVNVIINNPISQPRYWAGTVWLAALFSSVMLRRLWAFRLAAWAMLVSLAVLFPYTDYFRSATPDVAVDTVAGQLSGNGDYDGYQQVAMGIQMVSEIGHVPSYALSIPLAWVPRSSWPGKPEGLGTDIAEWTGYTFTQLSSPLWVEAYVWGGWLVVVGVFFGLGWISCRLDQWNWILRRSTLALAGTLVPAIAMFQMFAIRGPLLASAAPLAMVLGIALAITRPGPPRRDDSSLAVPGKETPYAA